MATPRRSTSRAVSRGACPCRRAISIAVAAIGRLLAPQPLEQLGTRARGVGLGLAREPVRLARAPRASRRSESVTLGRQRSPPADRRVDVGRRRGRARSGRPHRMAATRPDRRPAVAANIVWTGVAYRPRVGAGLLDTALPVNERDAVRAPSNSIARQGAVPRAAHTAIRRPKVRVGARAGAGGLDRASAATSCSSASRPRSGTSCPDVTVFTHLESLEDPTSWDDQQLDRPSREHC